MKEIFIQLFSESSQISSMRVMAMLALVFGFIIGLVGLIMRMDLSALSMLIGVFVVPAFAGKVGQKFVETKE